MFRGAVFRYSGIQGDSSFRVQLDVVGRLPFSLSKGKRDRPLGLERYPISGPPFPSSHPLFSVWLGFNLIAKIRFFSLILSFDIFIPISILCIKIFPVFRTIFYHKFQQFSNLRVLRIPHLEDDPPASCTKIYLYHPFHNASRPKLPNKVVHSFFASNFYHPFVRIFFAWPLRKIQ